MRKKRAAKKRGKLPKIVTPAEDSLALHTQFENVRQHIEKLWEYAEKSDERLQDIEIHLNLLTRLLTTLCVEKFGMRIGVLKRLIKRIEKEAIRDSQILHLESLYKLPHHPEKKGQLPSSPGKEDPWDDIS